MKNSIEIKVRYAETDQMGIVYHANYLIWFDMCRTEFFRRIGIDYRELEENGVLFPVIDAGCRYMLAAKFDQDVVVTAKLVSVRGVRLKLEYEVTRGTETLALGHTEHAFVDKNLKPIKLRKYYPEIWDCLMKALTLE